MPDEALLEECKGPDLFALASVIVPVVAMVFVEGAPASNETVPKWLASLCPPHSRVRDTYPFCPIHQPIRHHEIPRPHLLFQAANRAEPDHTSDAQFPQTSDVGAEGYFMRGVHMMQTVARNKGDDNGLGGWIGGAVG